MTEEAARHRFRFPVQVRFADTDLQGHVYFSNYLVYCDEALSAYLHAIGYPWDRLGEAGLELFFVDTGYRFLGSARFEERLDVHARIARLGNTSLTAEMTVCRAGGGEVIGAGHITAVAVDPRTRRPGPIPQAFRDAVAAYEAGA
ncbi:MAG: thioesterase family protein [Gammaproteobacteria bacterium]|nr:thioesterase family protein [Gammaproteobacteria bacterium]